MNTFLTLKQSVEKKGAGFIVLIDPDKKNDEKGNKDEQEKEKNEPQEDKNEQKNSENSDNESLEEKLKKINMSKKKAEMILNALNNNEFQYIQQLKRKPNKKKDSTKPDW